MTPAELFRRAGAALYGEHFVAPLAVALGVEKNTVGKWVAGKSPVPVGIWREVAALLTLRKAEVSKVLEVFAQGSAHTFLGHPIPPPE